MKINSFSINMNSSHGYQSQEISTQSVSTIPNNNISQFIKVNNADTVSLSQEAKTKYYSNKLYQFIGKSQVSKISDTTDNADNKKTDANTKKVIENIVRNVSGMKTSIKEIHTISGSEQAQSNPEQQSSMKFKVVQTYAKNEDEKTTILSSGIIKTSDNREINFGLKLEMQRSMSESGVKVQISDRNPLVDPLIISFNGAPPELSDTAFSFDIDVDGKEEKIKNLKSGSGFLAIDINHDGLINDGKELFGPTQGNGFQELSAYDSDGNKWIDENDSAYNDLVIWNKDESGKDKMTKLKDANIGAIYLGSVAADFSITNDTNEKQGNLKQVGLYVKENGEVQHTYEMDLKAEEEKIEPEAPKSNPEAPKPNIDNKNTKVKFSNYLDQLKDKFNVFSKTDNSNQDSVFGNNYGEEKSSLQKYLEKLDEEINNMQKEFYKKMQENRLKSQQAN